MFTIFKELEEQNQGRIQGVWNIFANYCKKNFEEIMDINWRNGETGKTEIFGKFTNFAIYVKFYSEKYMETIS